LLCRNPIPLNPLIQAMGTHPQPLTNIFDPKTPFCNLPNCLNPELLGKPMTSTHNTLLIA
jgi:hypothetical protein